MVCRLPSANSNEEIKMNKNEELELLRNRVKELEERDAKNKSESDPGRNFYKEIEEIKKKGKTASDHITYKDILDYTPITLYHTNGLRIGKQVGPLHPSNAEYAFKEFDRIGIRLSLRKPKEEEIERFKETPEYKKLRSEHDKKLEKFKKSTKASEIDKLTEAIAKMQGIKPQELNKVKEKEGAEV
jgi:hypothetical protein